MDEVANSTDMPRERMLHNGAQALADYELLAILLRTGSKGSNVLEFSRELLRVRGGLVGLFNSRAADLQAVRGLGKAKTAEILAVTELARRFMREEMRQPSWSFKTAADVRDYLLMQFKGQSIFSVTPARSAARRTRSSSARGSPTRILAARVSSNR